MRSVLFALLAALLSCGGSGNAPSATPKADVTQERWYGETVAQLQQLTREAETAYAANDQDKAAALITQGGPLSTRLMAATRPTEPAAAAATDLDDLYGRMLLGNRHYGWARMLFQKNQARWRHWEPPTPQTQARLKKAEAAIAECDRRIAQSP